MPVSQEMVTLTTGMLANQMRQDVISNNMANVNTIGYKKHFSVDSSFDTVLQNELIPPRAGMKALPENFYNFNIDPSAQVLVSEVSTAFKQGDMRATGNDFDLALSGEGFFAIETSEGVRYTRDGSFKLNSKQELVTNSGQRVLGVGESGKDGVPIVINGNKVSFFNDGTIQVDGASVGKLNLVNFKDYSSLKKDGYNKFVFNGDSTEKISASGITVESGFLEGSNVNALSEMTAMMSNTRQYEIAGKALKSIEQTFSRSIVELPKFK